MEYDAYIGLGANIGQPHQALEAALKLLADHPLVSVTAVSSPFETAPVGPVAQPDFTNMAAHLSTALEPEELLRLLLQVEQQLGRIRTTRWGPRTLDLDLLLYGDKVIEQPGLKVPHPRLHERGFVLAPLFQIAPAVIHPLLRQTVAQLYQQWRASAEDPDVEIRRADNAPGLTMLEG